MAFYVYKKNGFSFFTKIFYFALNIINKFTDFVMRKSNNTWHNDNNTSVDDIYQRATTWCFETAVHVVIFKH
jgi:chloramphenicol O-acetyltransferase